MQEAPAQEQVHEYAVAFAAGFADEPAAPVALGQDGAAAGAVVVVAAGAAAGAIADDAVVVYVANEIGEFGVGAAAAPVAAPVAAPAGAVLAAGAAALAGVAPKPVDGVSCVPEAQELVQAWVLVAVEEAQGQPEECSLAPVLALNGAAEVEVDGVEGAAHVGRAEDGERVAREHVAGVEGEPDVVDAAGDVADVANVVDAEQRDLAVARNQ